MDRFDGADPGRAMKERHDAALGRPTMSTSRDASEGSDRARRWRGVQVAVLVVPWVIGVLLAFHHSVDDTFITLRYGRNLLHGHGLVFNPGERVEGFSSPLHLALTTLVQWPPGGYVLLRVKVLSIIGGALTLVAAARLVARLEVSPALQTLALALVGASYPLAMASVNGLETSLFAWLMAALLLATVTGRSAAAPWRTGVIGGLVVLVRPEGVVLVAAIAITMLLTSAGPHNRWDRLRWAVVSAATFALLLAARLAYYGELLPNTYFAKDVTLHRALRHGFGYLAVGVVPGSTYAPHSVGAVLRDGLLVATVSLFLLGVRAAWRDRRWLVAPVVVIVEALLVWRAGGDWMAGSRFLAPVIVPLLLTVVLGVAELARVTATRSGPVGRSAAALATGLLVVTAVAAWTASARYPIWSGTSRVDDASLLEAGSVPRWGRQPALVSCVGPGGLVATSEVGYTPWVRPDLRFIDLRGLTDARIAHHAPAASHWITGVDDPDPQDAHAFVVVDVLRRHPDLIVTYYDVDPHGPIAARYREVDRSSDGMVAYLRRDLTCLHPDRRGAG